jgi:hypothetical protein
MPASLFYVGGGAAGFALRRAIAPSSAIAAANATRKRAGCRSENGQSSERGWKLGFVCSGPAVIMAAVGWAAKSVA